MMISIIAAVALDGAIGRQGGLVCHIREDMRHFRRLTMGHPVVMGRKTFESLPKGTLPNRRNVVITRQADFQAPGIEVFHSFEDALQACQTDEEVYVIGGESVYAAALPLAQRLCLTHIEAIPDEADTFFPSFDESQWVVECEEAHEPDEKNLQAYRFVNYRRK